LPEISFHRTGSFQHVENLSALNLAIPIQRLEKERMFVAKSVVDTLAIDAHVLHQILDRRSLVTARPENLHSLMEDFIAIELFLSRHSCCLGYPLYSFWNEQSRISPPELMGTKQRSVA